MRDVDGALHRVRNRMRTIVAIVGWLAQVLAICALHRAHNRMRTIATIAVALVGVHAQLLAASPSPRPSLADWCDGCHHVCSRDPYSDLQEFCTPCLLECAEVKTAPEHAPV